MKQELMNRIRLAAIIVGSLFVMVLFSACSGVAGTGPNTTVNVNGTTVPAASVQGTIVSIDAANHKVVVNYNNQQITISGLTDQQIQALQAAQAQGKTVSFQVAQNGSNSYVIAPNTEPQENDNNNTPAATNNGVATGSIQFTGQVQSSSSNNITVKLPDGQSLQMNIAAGAIDSDLNGVVPSSGFVKITATANADGSYTATKLNVAKPDDVQKDQNTVEYQGKTTSGVGSDGKLNFQVGNKTYSYQIGSTTELKDFGGNAQAIQSNIPVKVKVTFNGSTGTVTSVSNSND